MVIRNLTFAADRGDRVVILGPNGAGKSTFLRALLGLVPREKGTVLVQGQEMRTVDPSRVGYLAQGSGETSLHITVEEAVEVGTIRFSCSPAERKDRIREALRMTGMEGLRKRTLSTLSGGERRKTELARLFAQCPSVLLLDEPTANLDKGSKGEVLAVLRGYAENRRATVVMVSHEDSHVALPGWKYRLFQDGRLHLLEMSHQKHFFPTTLLGET